MRGQSDPAGKDTSLKFNKFGTDLNLGVMLIFIPLHFAENDLALVRPVVGLHDAPEPVSPD